MDELIQIFINHIPYDKEFVEALMPQYEKEFKLLGGYIKKHSTELWCKDGSEMQELFDFLDGNGFEVIFPEHPIPWDPHPIKLIPIYPPKTIQEELRELNEKIKEAVEKVQSTLSEYIPVQENVLSYTSMEDDPRPLLECEELFPPRPIRLRIRRCLEFLRLVPTSWGGSAALPRPP